MKEREGQGEAEKRDHAGYRDGYINEDTLNEIDDFERKMMNEEKKKPMKNRCDHRKITGSG